MKFKINSDNFAESLGWVTQGLGSHDDYPVVLNLTSSSSAILSFFDGDTYFRDEVEISVSSGDFKEESYSLSADFIKRLSKVVKDYAGDIEFNKVKDGLNGKSESGSTFKIPTHDMSLLDNPEPIVIGDVNESDYFDVITRLSRIPDSNGSTPMSSCIGYFIDGDQLVMLATDKYAFSQYKMEFTPGTSSASAKVKDRTYYLPASRANVSSSSKSSGGPMSLITDSKNKFGYSFPDGRICLFSTKGNDVNSAVTEAMQNKVSGSDQSARFSKRDLEKAIANISTLADSRDNMVRLIIDNESLFVSDIMENNQTFVTTSDNNVTGEVALTFDKNVLRKALLPVMDADVDISWTGEGTGVVQIKSIDTDGQSSDDIFIVCVTAKTS